MMRLLKGNQNIAMGGIACTLIVLICYGDEWESEAFGNSTCHFKTPEESVALGKSLYHANLTLSRIDVLVDTFPAIQGCLLTPASTIEYHQQQHQQKQQHRSPNLVIIVPYRNRTLDLLNFLLYMTPYLRRRGSDLNYEILVVEQHGNKSFNRAKLFNVAVREIFKSSAEGANSRWANVECIGLHDVDKLPMHPRAPYKCFSNPHQLLRMIAYKHGASRTYSRFLGGVTFFTRAQINATNGASNEFEGWGGEDDDLFQRIVDAKMPPHRASLKEGRFYEEEGADHYRNVNPDRFKLLARVTRINTPTDGFRQVKYRIIEREIFKIFTWMLVDIS